MTMKIYLSIMITIEIHSAERVVTIDAIIREYAITIAYMHQNDA
ncbi:hypothetical protein [Brachyspira hyodysenteriae]|nr:hypothetical protein [Brachyspira hyodysenteriae]MCZ9893922.1 hypothetical protein [Brachyspira hyodysenteriae]